MKKEEEGLKFKPHAEKDLPSREQRRSTSRKNCKFKWSEAEQVWFVRGPSREPAWLESRERSAR